MALGFGWFPNEPQPFANGHLAGAAFENWLKGDTAQPLEMDAGGSVVGDI